MLTVWALLLWTWEARLPVIPSPWASVDARATMMFTCAQPLPENAVAPAWVGAKAVSASTEAAVRENRVATRRRRRRVIAAASVVDGDRCCLAAGEAGSPAVPASAAKTRLSISYPPRQADGIRRRPVERTASYPQDRLFHQNGQRLLPCDHTSGYGIRQLPVWMSSSAFSRRDGPMADRRGPAAAGTAGGPAIVAALGFLAWAPRPAPSEAGS